MTNVMSSHPPFRKHQQYLLRCPKYLLFITQANWEIPLFAQGYCYVK